MQTLRWTFALLAALLAATGLTLLVEQLRQESFLRHRHGVLTQELAQARTLKQQREERTRQVAQVLELRRAALDLGLAPEHWIINHLDLDVAKNLQRRLETDPQLKFLEARLQAVTDQAATQAAVDAASPNQQLRQQLAERIRQRREAIEGSARYTPQSLQNLLQMLEHPAAALAEASHQGAQPLFAPRQFSVTRSHGDSFSVSLSGAFLIPKTRQPAAGTP